MHWMWQHNLKAVTNTLYLWMAVVTERLFEIMGFWNPWVEDSIIRSVVHAFSEENCWANKLVIEIKPPGEIAIWIEKKICEE